jgi:hypothetical protein
MHQQSRIIKALKLKEAKKKIICSVNFGMHVVWIISKKSE